MFNKGRMCGMPAVVSKLCDVDISAAHNKITEDMLLPSFHQNLQQQEEQQQ
jgi:hypothetical protein